MSDVQSLFDELEATLTNGPGRQRFTILRKVTDLFLAEADAYTVDHVALFDEVMTRLIDRIEQQALIELSGRLAPVERAPEGVIGLLSNNDDIAVAGPILSQSTMLSDDALVAIAQTRSQDHLAAIAERAGVSEPVTDVLIDRGDATVAQRVTENPGARFSRSGFSKAVTRAEGDDSLAMAVGSRIDLPDDLLEQLVSKASLTVQERLLATAPPEMQPRIAHVLATVSHEVVRAEAADNLPPDLRHDPVRLRFRIVECAESRNVPELLEALAALSDVPIKAIKDMARQGSDEGLLVIGKACGLGWHDLNKVLAALSPAERTGAESNALFASYTALSTESAQRAVRFIQDSQSKLANDMRRLAAAS